MPELEALHGKYGIILKEETAAAATEHSEDEDTQAPDEELDFGTSEEATGPQTEFATQDLSTDKKMVYSIVNEFLGQMTLNNPEAERLLLTALQDESCLSPSMHQRIEGMFSPIFFHYPNGLRDRSVWEPRDTSLYIRQWREHAAWRARIDKDANAESAVATEHGEQLSKEQVTQMFRLYLDDFKTSLRPEQCGQKWTYYKSCAESKLKRTCGSRFVANAIWEIGLPRLPLFATEQRGKQLSEQALEAIPRAIHVVLNWLDRLADTLTYRNATSEYATALRKSGVAHGQSGLTATELETRTALRKAKFQVGTAKILPGNGRTTS